MTTEDKPRNAVADEIEVALEKAVGWDIYPIERSLLESARDEIRLIASRLNANAVASLVTENELDAEIDKVREERDQLKKENEEWQQRFDRFWDADQRGIKAYQEKHGTTEEWPDHADLICWLMERVSSLAEDAEVGRLVNKLLHREIGFDAPQDYPSLEISYCQFEKHAYGGTLDDGVKVVERSSLLDLLEALQALAATEDES